MKQDLQNAVVEFQVLDSLGTGTFVLKKTPQTNAQLLQHLDLRSLSQVTQVINGKLGALNIQLFIYTATSTYLMYCEQMKML